MGPRRVLIAGCGDVGAVAGVALAQSGAHVWGLRRHADRVPRPIEPICADMAEPSSLHALPADFDTIVFAVAPTDARDEMSYRAVYVDGVRNVLEASGARDTRPRVVFASSTSVYAQDDGSWVDETSPTEPREFRGAQILAGERLVLDGPWSGTIARFGGIYGPGRKFLIEAVRTGRVGVTADGRSPYTNRIHRDDAARCLVHLSRLDQPMPVYLAVDSAPVPRDEVVEFLARTLGIEATTATGGGWSRGGNKRCSNRRLCESGFEFRFPTFREGYSGLLGR